MKSFILSLSVGLLSLSAIPGADAQVTRPKTVTPPATTTPGTTTPATAGAALTDESLNSMLRGLGYTPKVFEIPGGKMFHLSLERGGFRYEISLSLSPNKRKLWIHNVFAKLPDGRTITVDEMKALMDANLTWGPAHFRLDRFTNELSLGLGLDNRNITPEHLQTELDFYMQVVRETEPLWSNILR